MTTYFVIVPAEIRPLQNAPERQLWACPYCHRAVGEIRGDRLIVLVRRDMTLSFPLVDDLQMTCGRCHTVSALIESPQRIPISAGK